MEEVTLSTDAADACVAACQEFIDGLDLFLASTHDVVNKESFGTLRSGQDLGQKFVDVTTGKTYSMFDVLRRHLEVVTRLQAAFKVAGQRYIETDTQNAAHLTAQQPK